MIEREESSGDWKRVCQRLRSEFGESVFNSWFARLELMSIEHGLATCSVPTRFLKSWIESHFLDRFCAVLSAEFPHVSRVAVIVRSGARKPDAPPLTLISDTDNARETAPRQPAPVHRNEAADARGLDGLFSGSPLDRRFTFDNFLVGPSNQLAHAAAARIADSRAHAPSPYNPLYLHAAVGLGKTHLMQAIAHKGAQQGARVIYLTAEKFMYGFVTALKTQSAVAFKEKLRGIDILIFDDIQFLQGKSMQQEFCHTLNALIDAGRQVVVAADRPPGELENVDDRVRSRLSGGLTVEIQSFDDALRIKMVEARIQAARESHPGFDAPPEVIQYLASVVRTNGRDLEGAVNRLVAHVTFAGARLSVETAEFAIRDLVRTREPKRVKIEDILKLVASHYNVSRPDILSSRRTANVVRPRQIAMYLAKVLTLRSLPEIGRRFGGRDHTTVLHAVRKIEALTKTERALMEEVELLKRMLSE